MKSLYINEYGVRFTLLDIDDESSFPAIADMIYDAYIVNTAELLSDVELRHIASTPLRFHVEHVASLGHFAERIHDQIDEAAVELGFQSAVGEGVPMTFWNDDLRSFEEIAAYVLRGGVGGNDDKLVFIKGSLVDIQRFQVAMKAESDRRLSAISDDE